MCPEKHPLALGHHPQPPLLASPGAFPELWECWRDRGEHRSIPIEAVVLGSSSLNPPGHYLFCLLCLPLVSCSPGMEWFIVGIGRECVQDLIRAFQTPGRKGVLEFHAKQRALSDPTVWDHGNNRSSGVRAADSFHADPWPSFRNRSPREQPEREGQAQESKEETPVNTHDVLRDMRKLLRSTDPLQRWVTEGERPLEFALHSSFNACSSLEGFNF